MKKAFDTISCAVLRQLLEDLGVHGRVLDIIESSMYMKRRSMHIRRLIRNLEIFLLKSNKAALRAPHMYGLYVDGLDNICWRLLELMYQHSWES